MWCALFFLATVACPPDLKEVRITSSDKVIVVKKHTAIPESIRITKMQSKKGIVMNKEVKEWIDNADYEALLRRWRHSPMGEDPMFMEEGVTEYYQKVMYLKKETVDHVAISKKVGWR